MFWPHGLCAINAALTDDLPHGTGVFALTSGQVYDGEFKDGKMDARGRMQWPPKDWPSKESVPELMDSEHGDLNRGTPSMALSLLALVTTSSLNGARRGSSGFATAATADGP